MAVCIRALAHTRLWTFVDAFKTEVGGFGSAYIEPETKDIVIDDIFLVPQFVSAAEVDFNGDSLLAAIEKLGERLDDPNRVLVSWHSHHSMKAYWSQTDEKCIETYRDAGVNLLVSLVCNHDHEYKCRLDHFNVEHRGIKLNRVKEDDLTLFLDLGDPIFGDAYAEMDENVKVRKYEPPKWSSSYTTGTSPKGSDEKKVNATAPAVQPRADIVPKNPSDMDDDKGWLNWKLPMEDRIQLAIKEFSCTHDDAKEWILEYDWEEYDRLVDERYPQDELTGAGIYGQLGRSDYYDD